MTSAKHTGSQTDDDLPQPPMTTGQTAAEVIPEPRAADPAPDLATLLEKAEDEATELKNAWLRARADVENVRKQAQNDVAKAYKYAIERFAEELLPVKDSLELTLAAGNASPEALRSGVELTLKQLAAAFDKAQIKEVVPAGERFDPHQHQAMAMVDSDQPPNTVVNVLQKGYLLNDRVLRPALVAVAKGGDGNR
jgi:molecular chaperone GrpE